MRALTAVVLLLSLAGPGLAHTEGFTRLAGGGPRRTDCMLATDVAGVVAARRARVVRCRDGDIACDADGSPDGACRFLVRLCLQDHAPGCVEDTVTAAVLTSTASEFGLLAAALAAVPMPATAPDTCAPEAGVVVSTRGRRPGRLVLRAQVTMASGHADLDRIAFVCRPARAAATFATITQRIFVRSCASASCHGAVGAGGLTLTPGAAYGELVGVESSNPAARAAGLLRVLPGAPERSFLVRKLEGVLTPGQGDPMPRVGGMLSARDIELVRRWIAAGAPAEAPF